MMDRFASVSEFIKKSFHNFNTMRTIYFLILLPVVWACSPDEKSMSTIERIDPLLDSIVSPDAKAEIIGEGLDGDLGSEEGTARLIAFAIGQPQAGAADRCSPIQRQARGSESGAIILR